MTTNKLFFGGLALGCAALAMLAVILAHAGGAVGALALLVGVGALGTTINELPRVGDVVLFEGGVETNFTRDNVTVASGTAASVLGQVLGQSTIGAATSAVKTGGNTGAGTLTMDATTPILANAKPGIYTVTVEAVGTFTVTDPLGAIIGTMAYGAGAAVTFADRLKFAFHDDGTTHFILGDGFTVTVAAGSMKYTQVTPAAVDGSQYAAAILLQGFSAQLGADTILPVLDRGPAILKLNGLAWTSGMTAGQQTTALAQLAALGITTRTDYGV